MEEKKSNVKLDTMKTKDLAKKIPPIETKDKQALAYVNRKVSAWKELHHVVPKAKEQSYRRKMTILWYLKKRN